MSDETSQGAGDTSRYDAVSDMTSPSAAVLGMSVDHIPDPVLALHSDGTLVYANERAAEVLGWRREDFVGRQVLDMVHPDDLNLALSSMQTIEEKPLGDLIDVRVRCADGDWLRLEIRGIHVDAGSGPMTVLLARDATDRHLLELDQGEVAVLRAVMANMQGLVVLVNPDGRIRSVNGAVTRQLGHDPEAVTGKPFIRYLHPDDVDQVIDMVQRIPPHSSGSFDARFATDQPGSYVTCEFTVNNMTVDPVLEGFVMSGQVATALADARNRVDFLALHDSRTGLLNRDGFIREAGDLIRAGGGLGLLLLDVVHFRSINELYGERVGDQLLATIADRLDEIHWPDLLVSRFGGDEFVLAIRSASDSSLAMLEDRVRRDVGESLVVDGQEINFAVRTAVAFEERPIGLDSLLASASNEIVRIKRNADPSSGGISVDALRQRRRQLEELRRAIADGQIQPFFQPIVDAEGTVRAVEALARWVHPIKGVLGAGEILPLAQMAGLAELVDDHVLDQALEFAHRLDTAGYGHVEVHVNVDPKVISQPAFARQLLQRCDELGADPGQLVVELTETDLLAPGAASLTNMHELRKAGTHVSIDDFGTGYSSLSHLLELPVDGVKIDRKFVAGLDVDTTATNLTTAIVGLSRSLDLTCVAEGVEQPYQRDRLHDLGCDAFQGWLYAPAISASELLTLLPRVPLDPSRPSSSVLR